ncbi:helix-turn-helix domain-containing protein [Piscinibacter gummiphilus]|uniref:Helix-turn-helix domain-containing protein n=1 Tax=Piscinibacter gummiphilus TaxID=946333 RepID=A0ABZ0D0F8_9BURK|nr:helix-turn-helix domain-containing protein [Piscinibacter gummiphilus]WOB10221.1 helix-turn-helix domain-containing protein [Piscinibacter gummiphilus]
MVQQADRSAATTKAILDAARALFARHGYAEVSIDQIAQRAGYAKGAFYHHFNSKQEVFEQVLDGIQAQLAVLVAKRAQSAPAAPLPLALARNIFDYLEGATHKSVRQILLIDGPMVLGWKRWREIDDKHFADVVRAGVISLMPDDAGAAQVASATRLMLGAITEAALSSGMSEDPATLIREHCASFELLLTGLQGAGASSPRRPRALDAASKGKGSRAS